MPFNEIEETVDGCRTRIMRGGTGPPLIYLHGSNGAPAWLPFMEALSADFDVIVPEHPGYGGSDTPDWLDGIGDLAYFYLDLIAALGLDKVNLVGQSIGGWIAAELAVRDGSALNTLTLSGPAGIHVKGVRRADIFLWSPEETARNLVHDRAIAERMIATPLSDEQQVTALKNRQTTALLGWQPRMYNPDLRKWLHRIAVPTLILWGEEDRLLPLEYASAWRDLVPGAMLKTFPDSGHLIHVEKADDYTAALGAFIAEAGS